MTSEERPKSAVELAMERLRQKDAERGVSERAVTEEQKAAIAEARSVYASKAAELEILHKSKLMRIPDPDARALADAEYRRDLQRLHEEMERKVEKIRAAGG